MRITFHGAAQTVTGSQHLVEVNGHRVLLDCGLYQGRRAEARERNKAFAFDVSKLDAVVLSHAHIDHCGNLPSLAKAGYRGPIHATPATADLSGYMLRDSARIQESDVVFYNKQAARRGEPADAEALYTEEDALEVINLFRPQRLNAPFEVVPGMTATFYEAGHILGSAMVVLDIDDRRQPIRLVFSGDIGRVGLPILRDPTLLHEIGVEVDAVIMESTYGTKTHRPPEEAAVEFRKVVSETIARGGKVIVPAFAVGRTQELVYELHKMMREGVIPPIPVFVDSPLAINASDAFKRHAYLFDEDTQRLIQQEGDVFGFKSLRYTKSAEESKQINDVAGSCVILSASGMAEAGRILHHLKHNLGDPNNTVLIVSWQAPNTLGRRLADREPEVKIFGEWYPVRAQIATINGLSGHAGRDLLVKWATGLKLRARHVFLVHGEPESSAGLKAELDLRGMSGVHAPALHESVEI
jgi:metallo-beta-lactamase family protein